MDMELSFISLSDILPLCLFKNYKNSNSHSNHQVLGSGPSGPEISTGTFWHKCASLCQGTPARSDLTRNVCQNVPICAKMCQRVFQNRENRGCPVPKCANVPKLYTCTPDTENTIKFNLISDTTSNARLSLLQAGSGPYEVDRVHLRYRACRGQRGDDQSRSKLRYLYNSSVEWCQKCRNADGFRSFRRWKMRFATDLKALQW